MENANKVQHWNNSIASRVGNVRPTWIVGIVLVVILAGLTGFNPFLGITSALVLFLLLLVIPRPVLIVYGLSIIMPLTGGLTRGAVLPILRLGQALVVFAFILFLLARPSPQGKSRLTAIDLAFVLFECLDFLVEEFADVHVVVRLSVPARRTSFTRCISRPSSRCSG